MSPPKTDAPPSGFVSWILDLKGDIYGDERERLRNYEGIAVAASIQWMLFPWIVAAGAWRSGAAGAPYWAALAAVLYLPMVWSFIYILGRTVRPPKFTRPKALAIGMFSMCGQTLMGFSMMHSMKQQTTEYPIIHVAVGVGLLGTSLYVLVAMFKCLSRLKRQTAEVEE
jgi:hypothetical protein